MRGILWVGLAIALLGLVCYPTSAQLSFYNSSDGASGTSNRIGNFTFYNFSNGLSGTSNRIGNFTFHNFSNGLSGTSNRIGNLTFHNFP